MANLLVETSIVIRNYIKLLADNEYIKRVCADKNGKLNQPPCTESTGWLIEKIKLKSSIVFSYGVFTKAERLLKRFYAHLTCFSAKKC